MDFQTVFADSQLLVSSTKCIRSWVRLIVLQKKYLNYSKFWTEKIIARVFQSRILTHKCAHENQKLSCTGIWISYNFSPVDLRIAKLYIFWKLTARAVQWCMVLLCADQQQKSYSRFLAHLLIHLLITHWVRSMTTTRDPYLLRFYFDIPTSTCTTCRTYYM